MKFGGYATRYIDSDSSYRTYPILRGYLDPRIVASMLSTTYGGIFVYPSGNKHRVELGQWGEGYTRTTSSAMRTAFQAWKDAPNVDKVKGVLIPDTIVLYVWPYSPVDQHRISTPTEVAGANDISLLPQDPEGEETV